CGMCGLTYSGYAWKRADGSEVRSYRCNGRAQSRGLYGAQGCACPSPIVPEDLEELVWNDVAEFLHNPGDVLHELAAQSQRSASSCGQVQQRADAVEREVRLLTEQR